MTLTTIQPPGWPTPKGYSNGLLAPEGSRLLFTAGMVAWDEHEQIVGPGDFVTQFAKALANVVAVVEEAGGGPTDLLRLTIYVTDKAVYLASQKGLSRVYREIMGRHFPAMALVQVAGLVEEGAMLEIEGTAAIGGG
ncbi:MAG: RidA family protein [bacterium]|jgi:enamine deaminase RidA (YjgF/YER057c/UK114 family)|nr:RidA family protein [Planctomycetota bacterium]HIL51076.1 RidA family protein [Planctomycetota bacterium]